MQINALQMEMQINLGNGVRYHFKLCIIKHNNKCWQECGETGTLVLCWWKCKMVQLLWKRIW